MAPEKYLVRLVRPVFQAAYIELEGKSENDAAYRALTMAGDLPDDQWVGRFNPEDYAYDVHCVRSDQTKDGNPFSLLDFPKYCLLSTEDCPVLGLSAGQPWMDWLLPFVVASLYSKWISLLTEERVDYYDEGIAQLEGILKEWKGTDQKVVPLQPPAERRFDIDVLQATLDLAYVLKETD